MTGSTATPTKQKNDSAGSGQVAGSGEAASFFAAVDDLATFVADFEPGRYGPEDSVLLLSAFDRVERLGRAGKTLAATRAAESHPHLRTGHRSPAEWFAAQTGAGLSEAIDQLKLGEALASQPEVEEAFRAGKLSGAQASLISGAAKANPDQEHDLVNGAQHDTRRQLKDRCLKARQDGRSAEQAERAAEAIHQARRLRTWTDQEGAFRLDGLFTPEAGARLLASLGPVTDRFFHQARRDDNHEPSEAYAADALVALVTGTGIPARTRNTSGGSSTTGGTSTIRWDLHVQRDHYVHRVCWVHRVHPERTRPSGRPVRLPGGGRLARHRTRQRLRRPGRPGHKRPAHRPRGPDRVHRG